MIWLGLAAIKTCSRHGIRWFSWVYRGGIWAEADDGESVNMPELMKFYP